MEENGWNQLFYYLFHSKSYGLSNEARRGGFEHSRKQICVNPCYCGCKSGH